MSFSSRVICDPPPPSTRFIRTLTTALWVMPVAISIGCLAAVPSKAINLAEILQSAGPNKAQASTVNEPLRRIEPKTFAKIAATPYQHTLLDVRPENEPIFPYRLTLFDPVQPEKTPVIQQVAEKSPMKVATVAQPPQEKSRPPAPEARTLTIKGYKATAPLVETRIYRDTRAIAANALSGDGSVIVLAGIEPPTPGTQCRRLDGVLEDCNERARGRLSVLIMDRLVKCNVSALMQQGVRVGQCFADKINIGSDLLRHGLANRATATNQKPIL